MIKIEDEVEVEVIKTEIEVELKDLGNGEYEMGEVRTNKKMELIKYMKEFQKEEKENGH